MCYGLRRLEPAIPMKVRGSACVSTKAEWQRRLVRTTVARLEAARRSDVEAWLGGCQKTTPLCDPGVCACAAEKSELEPLLAGQISAPGMSPRHMRARKGKDGEDRG